MTDSAPRPPEVLIVGAGPQEGNEIIATVSTMTGILSSRDLLPRTFRRLLLPILLRLPFFTRLMARRMVDV